MSERKHWVAWDFDQPARYVAEDIVLEINDMLKDKGITIGSWIDTDDDEWAYKFELWLNEKGDRNEKI